MSDQTTQRMARQPSTRADVRRAQTKPGTVSKIPLAFHPAGGLLCKRRSDWLALPDDFRVAMIRANLEAKREAKQAFAFFLAQASAIEPAAVLV
jgi:hypothetical protein